MIEMPQPEKSRALKWTGIGCATLVVLAAALIVAGWLWNRFGTEPEQISMHGAVILSSPSEFVRTGEKTYTGNDRCVGTGARAILKGDQQVTVRPSKGGTTKILLQEGFVNGEGGCEMWFIGDVADANSYVVTVPTFENATFQRSLIDVQGRTGESYLAPTIRS